MTRLALYRWTCDDCETVIDAPELPEGWVEYEELTQVPPWKAQGHHCPECQD